MDTLIRQEVYMEPLDTRVVFGLDRILRIHGPYGEISRNSNNTLTAMTRLKSYEVYSRFTPINLEQLRRAPEEVSEPIRKFYLQLPYRSANIEQLAKSITTNQRTSIDRALAVRNYLQRNYSYSTSELPQSSNDPISEFLFVKRSGTASILPRAWLSCCATWIYRPGW